MATLNNNKNYTGAAHPLSDEIKNIATKRLDQFPKRSRFGDARDAYRKALASGDNTAKNPCTSKGLSTMPRRQR